MNDLKPFLTKDQIDQMVLKLGQKISSDYRPLLSDNESLLVIITLKGALFFGADLARKITVATEVDFVRAASYGSGTKSTGTVRLLKDIETNLDGRHVLVVDEIVDSGRTLNFLVERLKSSHPKSVKVAALLSKPSRRETPVEIHYLGSEIEDHFVVGYGLDYGEKYRSLEGISILTPK